MIRLAVSALALMALSTPVAAQDHGAHGARPPAARPPVTRPAPARPAQAAPARPAQAAPARPRPAAAPETQADPHAGHVMPAAPAPAGAASPDPHAGYEMNAPATAPSSDPHAGHAMTAPATAPASGQSAAQAADPHAGHDMAPSAGAAAAQPADPHAGHNMSGMTMGPPNVPTSADNPGRPPQAAPPAGAFSGPAHAADGVFGETAMTDARRLLLRENGAMTTTAVVIDRLEVQRADGRENLLWDLNGWTGGDINRFWWKSEGDADFDGEASGEVQALYSRAIRPFWDVQAGVRQDFGDDRDETHLVLGIQGLAPHWWEVDAAAFLSTRGDLTARVEAEYDQRLTQRLILQPRFEIEASASDIPELGVGSGFSHVEAGLRLRYEFYKEFAPYIGVEWSRDLGGAADYTRAAGGDPETVRAVIGVRAWF